MVNYYDNFKLEEKNDGYNKYVVKEGDTLYKIAKMYQTTPEILMQINNLNSTMIYVGQILFIPCSNNGYYVTIQGDTISSIAKKLNVSIMSLIKNSKAANLLLVPGQVITNERERGEYHVVLESDSLGSILNEYDKSIEELVKLNIDSILTPGVRIRVK